MQARDAAEAGGAPAELTPAQRQAAAAFTNPASVLKLLIRLTETTSELGAAREEVQRVEAEKEALRGDIDRLRDELRSLSERMKSPPVAAPPVPTRSSRNRSPSAPRHELRRGGSSGGSDPDTSRESIDTGSRHARAGSSYSWFARVNETTQQWEFTQGDGQVPIEADYLLRDENTRRLIDAACRHSAETADLAQALLERVAAAERNRNEELERRKVQLQSAIQHAASRKSLDDCAQRLSTFERVFTGLQRQHHSKLVAVINQSIHAVREIALEEQQARRAARNEQAEATVAQRPTDGASAAAADATVVVVKPDQGGAAMVARPSAPEVASTLPSEPAALHSANTTLPDPDVSIAASSLPSQAAPRAPQQVRYRNPQPNPTSVTIAHHQHHHHSSHAPAGADVTGSADATIAMRVDTLAQELYRDLERTRRETSTAPLDLQARVLEFQRQEVARANASTADTSTRSFGRFGGSRF